MTVQDQIYTIVLPLLIAVAFGLAGLFRGAFREGIVAASVALGAFIVKQWGDQWGAGLHDVFTTFDRQQGQFAISLVVLWLVVLVTGYGLSGLLPRQPLSTPSRLLGGLLGLASGAAIAGWSLQYAFSSLEGGSPNSPLYKTS